jgi:ferritin-like metal-binding protein YciE
MATMNDLMLHFMQDIYYAEKLGVRSMAKLAKAVENKELKEAILAHREQSQHQIERLDQVFEALGKRAKSKTCAAMDGLAEEGAETVEEFDRGPVLDAALIACGQAIEHYEIARYGAMVAWAKQLGLNEAADLLQQTLDEEKANDGLLNELAERVLNPQASAEGSDEDGEGIDTGDEPKGTSTKKRAKK